ncbi:MAG TPA: hypothetical protein VFF52_17080, partial [Isosphaeraceae bacterium]|nr:hypothetical protein [Isosphaeraceae bacterium]
GERLVVVYSDLGMAPAQVQHRLASGPLPKLWVPAVKDFLHVAAIPITATGKVDLRRVRELALDHQRAGSESTPAEESHDAGSGAG